MLRYSLAVSGIGVVAGPFAADAPRPISTAERWRRPGLSLMEKKKMILLEERGRRRFAESPLSECTPESSWRWRGRGTREAHEGAVVGGSMHRQMRAI
ncbi:MAG: hypothetical protein ACPIOQ_21450 [Promethearchaeia archaeon]